MKRRPKVGKLYYRLTQAPKNFSDFSFRSNATPFGQLVDSETLINKTKAIGESPLLLIHFKTFGPTTGDLSCTFLWDEKTVMSLTSNDFFDWFDEWDPGAN